MDSIMMYIGLIIIILFLLGAIFFMRNSLKKTNEKIDILNQSLVNKDSSLVDIVKSSQQTLSELTASTAKQDSVVRIDERFENIYKNLENLTKNSVEATTQVNSIASRVNALNDVMVNKKSRGNWGEYQLNNLLSVYAGDNQNIFEVQYKLKNGYIGDVALHLPDEEKVMIIDSKFPLENYQNLLNDELPESEKVKYESLLKQNVKKHINDIAKKYITSETVENAVMFIPSEAIYMFICGNYGELIDYAHQKHILMTCPTTLIGVVFTLVNITKDFNRTKHIKQLEKDIVGMYEDVNRLNDRVATLDNSIQKLAKPIKDVQTSTGKIVNRVSRIYDGYVVEEEEEEK